MTSLPSRRTRRPSMAAPGAPSRAVRPDGPDAARLTSSGRRPGRAACALSLLVLAAGCVPRPTGPILGDWRGTQPGPWVDEPKIVELVLDGAPDAVAGRYHIAVTLQNTLNGAGSGTTRWQGEWTGDQETIGGRVVHVIRLRHMFDGEIDRYELSADGALRPLNGAAPGGNRYSAAQVAPYVLQPLRRDSWNYGVD